MDSTRDSHNHPGELYTSYRCRLYPPHTREPSPYAQCSHTTISLRMQHAVTRITTVISPLPPVRLAASSPPSPALTCCRSSPCRGSRLALESQGARRFSAPAPATRPRPPCYRAPGIGTGVGNRGYSWLSTTRNAQKARRRLISAPVLSPEERRGGFVAKGMYTVLPFSMLGTFGQTGLRCYHRQR